MKKPKRIIILLFVTAIVLFTIANKASLRLCEQINISRNNTENVNLVMMIMSDKK
jgi:hypothetical protein